MINCGSIDLDNLSNKHCECETSQKQDHKSTHDYATLQLQDSSMMTTISTQIFSIKHVCDLTSTPRTLPSTFYNEKSIFATSLLDPAAWPIGYCG